MRICKFISLVWEGLRCRARTLWLKGCYGASFSYGRRLRYRKDFVVRIGDGHVKIGDNVFFNNACSINCHVGVVIGDDCLFGENVKIYDHNHRFNLEGAPSRAAGFTEAPVSIGDNVWVCANTVICRGVSIGDGCVIAAGAVVRGDVPPNTMVATDGAYSEIVRKAG